MQQGLMRGRWLRGGALIAAGAAVLSLGVSRGAAAQAMGDPAVAVLVRDNGFSVEQAEKQLAVQAKVSGLDEELARLAGASYGGMWFDAADGGRLKVGLVAGAQSDSVRVGITQALAAKGLQTGDAMVVPVRSSWQQLVAAQADLDHGLDDLIRRAAASTGIDTASNQVFVETASSLTEEEAARVDRAIAGVGARAVRRLSSRASLELSLHSCSVPFCDRPLRGGVRIAAGSGCTAGFNARSRSGGKLFVLTAGHCMANDAGTWKTRTAASLLDDIGIRHNWMFGDSGDAGIIRNWIAYWAGPPAPGAGILVPPSSFTTYAEDYGIGSVSTSSVGQIVCMSSGYQLSSGAYADCGGVQALSRTRTFDGVRIGGLAETNLCGAYGSSGGPIYKGNVAYGLDVGGPDYICNEYYQGIVGAQNALNVDVLTR